MKGETNMHNPYLLIGGILSCIAALLHIAIIVGGAKWYRFFGAGEKLASMDEAGSLIPALITFGIALVLAVWGLYAFAGAGLIRPLPFMKAALVTISAVYLLRGLAIVPAYLFSLPVKIDAFLLWSSVICTGYGLFYAAGTRHYWLQGA